MTENRVRVAVFTTLAILQLAAGPPEVLNTQVLEFARAHQGERVGNGQCTSLVYAAFRHVGARRFPPSGGDEDYVWGAPVERMQDVRPGDVLQFRDAVFKGRKTYPNGSYRYWSFSYPHHTAIVSGVKTSRGAVILTVLHQNVTHKGQPDDEPRVVRADTINMAELQKGGVVRAYRPVPIDPE